MHYLSLQLLIALSLIFQLIAGLVTLQTIRNLTTLTDECKDMIVDSGGVVVDELARVLGGGQVVLNSGEEVEDVSSDVCSWDGYRWKSKGNGSDRGCKCWGWIKVVQQLSPERGTLLAQSDSTMLDTWIEVDSITELKTPELTTP
ncbi:uncharacterized protein K444DRAFT_618914 [Hyaloscypha bicolor E]|uniref:Uncharacterized protein n=1 Tax=Hyaloscypha bicolor E TaxID=1095630 RepID=A0A2J6SSI7_9HELO|nr:uncharacterized protein K444DRAFT_618914 [Hyaloscypha bicolor E]PMD53727.1 hypothetical protein K444DRAFT_618914 [Hyaloscypha bicolor E]